MNQIMNVAVIGMGSSAGSDQQASQRKPAHAKPRPRKPAHAKASLAARKGSEGSFRIPRGGAVASPAGNGATGNAAAGKSAGDELAGDKQQPERRGRHRADLGNGQGGTGGKGDGQDGKPAGDGTGDNGDGTGGKGGRRNKRNKGGHCKGSPKKRKVLIALLIVALLLGGFGIWKFMNLSPEEATVGAFYDQSASEIQEAVDHEVEDGYFNMSINTSVPVFDDNSAAIGIRNIESNQYDCIVTVTLEDGTEVYKSGGLAPGTQLSMVTLTHTLEPGDYEATAVFEIIEQDEAHTVVGQTASKLTLHVL